MKRSLCVPLLACLLALLGCGASAPMEPGEKARIVSPGGVDTQIAPTLDGYRSGPREFIEEGAEVRFEKMASIADGLAEIRVESGRFEGQTAIVKLESLKSSRAE